MGHQRVQEEEQQDEEEVTSLINLALHTEEEEEQVRIAPEEEAHQEATPRKQSRQWQFDAIPTATSKLHTSAAVRRSRSPSRYSTNYPCNDTVNESLN